LGLGLRLVLVLIVPATLGLAVLAEPVVALLFEHGKFTAYDTYWTAWALRLYLVGLVFASIDWPLNYAFYAQQDTLSPALVGILSVGVYIVVALSLIQPLGMLGLVLADSAKHLSHAMTMLVLTWRRMGRLSDLRLGQTTVKVLIAASAMAGLIVLTMAATDRLVHTEGLLGDAVAVIVPAGVGALAYLGLVSLFRIEEVDLLWGLLRKRLQRSNLD